MSKQVPWTKDVLKNFEEMAMLNETECFIMENRVKGMTVTSMAFHLSCSESSVHRTISDLKKRYDIVQKEHPDMFPERKASKAETYMDTH